MLRDSASAPAGVSTTSPTLEPPHSAKALRKALISTSLPKKARGFVPFSPVGIAGNKGQKPQGAAAEFVYKHG